LCPDNRITGGKIYSAKTCDVKSRVATALRLAARSLHRAQNYFRRCLPKMEGAPGRTQSLTALAHKLARVLWHLLKYRQEFDWNVFAKEEAKMKRKKVAWLFNMAESLNYQLVPKQ